MDCCNVFFVCLSSVCKWTCRRSLSVLPNSFADLALIAGWPPVHFVNPRAKLHTAVLSSGVSHRKIGLHTRLRRCAVVATVHLAAVASAVASTRARRPLAAKALVTRVCLGFVLNLLCAVMPGSDPNSGEDDHGHAWYLQSKRGLHGLWPRHSQ